MKKLLCIYILSFNALADTNIANNFTYISIGLQKTDYSSIAMNPYFNDKYSNNEEKSLGGGYIDVNATLVDKVFIDASASSNTRISSKIKNGNIGLGYPLYSTTDFSIPASCGLSYYGAERDALSYSERAPYCKLGFKKQIANHWLLDTAYQHDFFNESKKTLAIKNVFQFGSVFGLVAGFKYAERKSKEVTYQVGVQFSFD